MSDAESRLRKIAQSMIEQTNLKNISWRMTDRENTFVYSGTNSSVTITAGVDEDGDELYSLRVLNSKGATVGELRTSWIFDEEADDPWATKSYRPGRDNKMLESLYEAARRSALQIDEVLDALEEDLNLPPF